MNNEKLFKGYMLERAQAERRRRRVRKKQVKVIAIAIVMATLAGALIYTHYTYSATSHWVVVKEVKEVKNEEYI